MKLRPLAVAAVAGLTAVAPALLASPAGAAPTAPRDAAPQRYLVRTDSVRTTGQALGTARADGLAVRTSYRRVFPGFAATLTPEEVQRLRQDPHVQAVVPDRVLHATTTQKNPTWGLDRIDQRSTTGNHAYAYDRTGRRVTAYVLDTGIRVSHTEFGGRARSGYDFVDRDGNANDCNGHGTHVAGTIGGSTYGVAKKVTLVGVRVLDCDGAGYLSDVLDGLDWVVSHRSGPAVVNLSLGGDADGYLDDAIRQTVAAGIPVVVAAGNEEVSACTESPARVPQAITVAATDAKDRRPSWSNYGRCVDLFAPGVGVRSAYPSSNTATAVGSGTSMAAPHVTGVVARYLESHRSATPAQVSAALVSAATTGKVRGTSGSPNRLLYAAPR